MLFCLQNFGQQRVSEVSTCIFSKTFVHFICLQSFGQQKISEVSTCIFSKTFVHFVCLQSFGQQKISEISTCIFSKIFVRFLFIVRKAICELEIRWCKLKVKKIIKKFFAFIDFFLVFWYFIFPWGQFIRKVPNVDSPNVAKM